jgi:hypothetical protein
VALSVIDNDTCIDAIGFGHTISSVLGSSPDDVHQLVHDIYMYPHSYGCLSIDF